MKTAQERVQHPVSVLAFVGIALWVAATIGAAGAVLFNWYGALVLGPYPLPAGL